MRLEVTEHRRAARVCSTCGQASSGQFPSDVAAPPQYGPRLQSSALLLHQANHLPLARSASVLSDLFHCSMSQCSIVTLARRMAQRAAPIVEMINEALTRQPVVHGDETSATAGGLRQWVQMACTDHLTLLALAHKRGSEAMREIGVLPEAIGAIMHDDVSAYRLMGERHATCNAHHLRELEAVATLDHEAWADNIIDVLDGKRETERARELGLPVVPDDVRANLHETYECILAAALAAHGPPPPRVPGKRGKQEHTKAKNLLDRLKRDHALVRANLDDLKIDKVDNNQAGRDLRMVKLQQKVSGCFRTTGGGHDFRTIRSYPSTMHKQGYS